MRKLALFAAVMFLIGCSAQTAPQPTLPAAPETVPAQQPTEAPTETQPTLWIDEGVPPAIREAVIGTLPSYPAAPSPEEAAVRVTVNPAEVADLSAQWTYTLAAPFPTITDGMTWEAFRAFWTSGDFSGTGYEAAPTLIATPDTVDLLIALIGPTEGVNIQMADSSDALSSTAWASQPALIVAPFEALTPSLKVLTLDGVSVLDGSAPATPLTITVGVSGGAANQIAENWPATNRDPAKISKVVLTGTTAIARATAMQVELNGFGFPSEQIMPFFADADILHTSNESSYATDCPPPDWYGEPKFCSQRSYFEVLTSLDLDIVEKTGNHIADYGLASLHYTLDVYDNNGLPYYGGGRNLSDAREPRILTTPDGTRVAFIGCNSAGPFPVWATDASAGAAPCDDWSAITSRIQTLKANDEADIVIATLQYLELPSYEPSAEQIADFERLAAAGADIVSGSQAHQPQGFGFSEGAFIHYGIGNLFFDQMDFIENRQMFADKHVLYDGRHISTELFTGMMEAWAQPRPMTEEERREFLRIIFDASNW